MLPLYTRDEMRAVDRAASERYGIPSSSLMESAGARATDFLLARYRDLRDVLIVGGEGQNGGDGWVVARHLLARGVRARCVLIGSADKVRGDARVNLDALAKLGISVSNTMELEGATLIVDALFGTGLARALTGLHAEVVARINDSGVAVLALDLPSGIDADSGQILGSAIKADATVTFAGHKRGLFQFPGVEHAGVLHVASIGAPVPDSDVAVIEAHDVAALLPRSERDAHKGSRGHVLVIAGSKGKTGAALLSSFGALRGGAGLVTIAADRDTQPVLELKVLEVMTAQFSDAASIAKLAEGKGAAVLGPGFGVDDERKALVRELARELPLPCVLDADALTALGSDLEQLQRARAPRVLTPHPGEASRLLGRSTPEVQADRYGAVRELARRSGHVVVLKGAHTVIGSPEGAVRVCRAGTPALGVAGTGDVLSGVLGALTVRLSAFSAAWASVQIHAVAGEIAAISDRGLFAHEVADAIPRALEQARAET
ncbi:MAG TPA: NAD(P)H-hydrate dehydratase [Polyangiales bacterium]|nr:NAD(P)H-hydrate dehydratase [Polyangiales bacterium]